MYDNSNKIGNIGEAIAIAEFTKRGIPILLPFRQNSPYNLAIQLNTRLFKVQCITTEKINNGVMKFEICRKMDLMENVSYIQILKLIFSFYIV